MSSVQGAARVQSHQSFHAVSNSHHAPKEVYFQHVKAEPFSRQAYDLTHAVARAHCATEAVVVTAAVCPPFHRAVVMAASSRGLHERSFSEPNILRHQNHRLHTAVAASLRCDVDQLQLALAEQQNYHLGHGIPKRKERFRTSDMNDIQDSAIHCQVVIREGKYKGEIGTIKRSGHGFYGVELSGRGEIMKRGAELALLDGTTLGKEKRKRGLFNDTDKSAHLAPLEHQFSPHQRRSQGEPKRRRCSSTASESSYGQDAEVPDSPHISSDSEPILHLPEPRDCSSLSQSQDSVSEDDDFAAYHQALAVSERKQTSRSQHENKLMGEESRRETELAPLSEKETEAQYSEEETEPLSHDTMDSVLPWARTSGLKSAMAVAFGQRSEPKTKTKRVNGGDAARAKRVDDGDAASLLLALRSF
eukprot:gb/GEZN01004971.1/.p1 GENE.gb/GEZN01004971.1/~~gb/GEZN01004971.1/.p1  ORF type:complete len:457 (+),score=57.21 gb/GEZN01004971.1/:120-1373(+)